LSAGDGRGGGASGLAEAPLSLAERSRLDGLRLPKRRADWLVGRTTAKGVVAAALAESFPADWPPRAIEIASEPSGRPYPRLAAEARPIARFAPGARLPVSVSISHAEGRALCAAALSGAPRPDLTLGIDLGRVEPRSAEFVRTFFTDEEQRFVAGAPPPERDLRANLVWCAKEAVLKALGLGLSVDTLELTCLPSPDGADPLEWQLEPADAGWRRFVATCGARIAPARGTIRGIWRSFGGFAAALASCG
jgi:4'-phosphopantetheinyl transferase